MNASLQHSSSRESCRAPCMSRLPRSQSEHSKYIDSCSCDAPIFLFIHLLKPYAIFIWFPSNPIYLVNSLLHWTCTSRSKMLSCAMFKLHSLVTHLIGVSNTCARRVLIDKTATRPTSNSRCYTRSTVTIPSSGSFVASLLLQNYQTLQSPH